MIKIGDKEMEVEESEDDSLVGEGAALLMAKEALVREEGTLMKTEDTLMKEAEALERNEEAFVRMEDDPEVLVRDLLVDVLSTVESSHDTSEIRKQQQQQKHQEQEQQQQQHEQQHQREKQQQQQEQQHQREQKQQQEQQQQEPQQLQPEQQQLQQEQQHQQMEYQQQHHRAQNNQIKDILGEILSSVVDDSVAGCGINHDIQQQPQQQQQKQRQEVQDQNQIKELPEIVLSSAIKDGVVGRSNEHLTQQELQCQQHPQQEKDQITEIIDNISSIEGIEVKDRDDIQPSEKQDLVKQQGFKLDELTLDRHHKLDHKPKSKPEDQSNKLMNEKSLRTIQIPPDFLIENPPIFTSEKPCLLPDIHTTEIKLNSAITNPSGVSVEVPPTLLSKHTIDIKEITKPKSSELSTALIAPTSSDISDFNIPETYCKKNASISNNPNVINVQSHSKSVSDIIEIDLAKRRPNPEPEIKIVGNSGYHVVSVGKRAIMNLELQEGWKKLGRAIVKNPELKNVVSAKLRRKAEGNLSMFSSFTDFTDEELHEYNAAREAVLQLLYRKLLKLTEKLLNVQSVQRRSAILKIEEFLQFDDKQKFEVLENQGFSLDSLIPSNLMQLVQLEVEEVQEVQEVKEVLMEQSVNKESSQISDNEAKSGTIRISCIAKDPARSPSVPIVMDDPTAGGSELSVPFKDFKVEAEPVKNSPAAKMVARFIWFIVEANNLYPLLNCTSHSYIIHTSKATKTNDVSCKLFIAQGQHDWLTKDPYIWENVGVAFEPPSSSPEAALFSIGSSTVVAKIPGMIQEMSDLVKAGKPFILSTERMKKFQRTLLRENTICSHFSPRNGGQELADVNYLGQEWLKSNASCLDQNLYKTYTHAELDEFVNIINEHLREHDAGEFTYEKPDLMKDTLTFVPFYRQCASILLSELSPHKLDIRDLRQFLSPSNVFKHVAPNWTTPRLRHASYSLGVQAVYRKMQSQVSTGNSSISRTTPSHSSAPFNSNKPRMASSTGTKVFRPVFPSSSATTRVITKHAPMASSATTTRVITLQGSRATFRAPVASIPVSTIQTVPRTTLQAGPISAIKAVPMSSSLTAPVSAIRAVPVSSFQPVLRMPINAVPISSIHSVPRLPVRAVPISSIQSVPRVPTQAVPISSIQSVPRIPIRAVPISSFQSVPRVPIQAVPISYIQSVPRVPIQAVPISSFQSVRRLPTQAFPISTLQSEPILYNQSCQPPYLSSKSSGSPSSHGRKEKTTEILKLLSSPLDNVQTASSRVASNLQNRTIYMIRAPSTVSQAPLQRSNIVENLGSSVPLTKDTQMICPKPVNHESGSRNKDDVLFSRNVAIIKKKVGAEEGVSSYGSCVYCNLRKYSNILVHMYSNHLQHVEPPSVDKVLILPNRSKFTCSHGNNFKTKVEYFLHACKFHTHLIYEMIAEDLYGTDLMACNYPWCQEDPALSEEGMQRHLYSEHLQEFIEKEIAMERGRTNISPQVCPIKGCGFPTFYDRTILSQHFAYTHKKVNSVYRHFCKSNNWSYADLRQKGFFVEPNEVHPQIVCSACKSSVQEDYFFLHVDSCACDGSMANELSLQLRLSGANDLKDYTTAIHTCPVVSCKRQLNFPQLFLHYLSQHSKFLNLLRSKPNQPNIPAKYFGVRNRIYYLMDVPLGGITEPAKENSTYLSCPDCQLEFLPNSDSVLQYFVTHVISHLRDNSRMFLQNSSEDGSEICRIRHFVSSIFNYSGIGCPFPNCHKRNSKVVESHFFHELHNLEVCLAYMFMKKQSLCTLLPYLSEKNLSFIKSMEDYKIQNKTVGDVINLYIEQSQEALDIIDLDQGPSQGTPDIIDLEPSEDVFGTLEDIQIVSVTGSTEVERTPSCSPGIEFVPPRSTSNSSRFVASCEDLALATEITSKRILPFKLFKDFIVFLVEMCVESKAELREEIMLLSNDVDHVILYDEIHSISHLNQLPLFQKVWNCFKLLQRFQEQLVSVKSRITTCEPMQVVIIMSQFIEDPQIPSADISTFLSIINEIHVDDNKLDKSDIILDFIECEKIQKTKLFVQKPTHKKFMTCRTCFSANCYFPSYKEVTAHIKNFHSRKKPGKIGCIRCPSTKMFNVTSDAGSTSNFFLQMDMHQTSRGHIRSIFGQVNSVGGLEEFCFLCNKMNRVEHSKCSLHIKRVKVLDFYLELCNIASFNPFEYQAVSTYIFAVKLMLSETIMGDCSFEDWTFVVRRFLGMDVFLPNLEDIKSPAVAFCIPCQAVFSDKTSVQDHAATCRSFHKMPLKCIQCNSLFHEKDLSVHLPHFESYSVYYTCMNHCREGFVALTSSDVLDHAAYHKPGSTTAWNCSLCYTTLQFVNDKNLSGDVETHTRVHQRRPSAEHQGRPERRATTVDEYLNWHPQLLKSRVTISVQERSTASKAYKTSVDQSNIEVSSVTDNSLRICGFRCLHCKSLFSSPDDLQVHYLTDHQIIPTDKIKVEPAYKNLPLSQEFKPEQGPSSASASQKRKVSSDGTETSAKRRKIMDKWTVRKKSHDNEVNKDYFYFCCDCEKSRVGCHDDCDHFSHPRIPIGFDISGHMLETGHSSLSPIPSFLPAVNVRLENLSLSRTHGHTVRRKWKALVTQGLIRDSVYLLAREAAQTVA